MLRTKITFALTAALVAAGLMVAKPVAAAPTWKAPPQVTAKTIPQKRPLTERDRQEIEFVVQSHISAMVSGDAGIVYLLITQQVKKQFPNPALFFRFVSQVHKPLTVAKAVRIGSLDVRDTDKPVQSAFIRDQKGIVWSVSWTMQRAKDSSWRISNCRIFFAHSKIA